MTALRLVYLWHDGMFSSAAVMPVTQLVSSNAPAFVYREWAWTLWEATVPLPEGAGQPGSRIQLAARAVDSQYNAQPDNVAPLWNIRGVLNNAWHRIEVPVE